MGSCVLQVLCASNASHDKVDPIAPPPDAQIGERIKFEGFTGEPDAQLNPKKKIFEKLADDLVTNAGAHSAHHIAFCLSFCHRRSVFIAFLTASLFQSSHHLNVCVFCIGRWIGCLQGHSIHDWQGTCDSEHPQCLDQVIPHQ